MMKSNLLFDAFRWVQSRDKAGGDIGRLVNPLLMTIHVACFSYGLAFTENDTLTGAYPLSLRQSVYHIKWSQDVVLASPDSPLVNKYGAVDMGLLYHLTNFWRFHLILNDDGAVFRLFNSLNWNYKPIIRGTMLEQNKVFFSRNWIGAMCE